MPSLNLKALYYPHLFDAAVVERILGHLQNLLLAMLADPTAPLAGLPVLSEPERHQLWVEWNDTGRDLSRAKRAMHELFELQAESGAERVGLICAGEELRYGEINRRANRVAHLLLRRGAVLGSLVGVLMEPGLETVVALLGVLKSGGAYVPLDPSYPADRLSAMLADVPLLLTESRWIDRLPAHGAQVICLDAAGAELARESEVNPGLRVTLEDLAYVIYTSGSTGRPKGVAIDHGAAVNTLLDVNERFGVGEQDRVLALSALSFDLSVYDLFGLLAAGGAAVLVPSSLRRDPAAWWELVRRHGVTIWNTVPALAEMFAEQAALNGAGQCGLRLVLMSGDWIPLSLPDRLGTLGEGVEVVSLGGATEGSIWSIFYPVGAVSPGWTSIPYGRPLWNQTFHVLGQGLEPQPIGVVGELYIGGRGVAREYWGDAGTTAASFRPHPRLGKERLYRTGDLGRRQADGTIEFLGRADHQVKIRGFRIELGEVEAVLAGCSGVKEAVAMVREDLVGGRGLVAYVVPEKGVAKTPKQLQEAVRGKLPEYMIPADWVLLGALPLTANGKLDRRALPVPQGSRGEERRYVAPRSPVEGVVAGIWEELLGRERVGVEDDFFALGGHSLLATQVVSRLSKALGVELSVRLLFDAPTLAELAQAVDEARRAGAGVEARPILLVPRAGELRLSFAQQRLWFLDRLSPENATYNVPGLLRLEGRLDGPALERSLSEIVRRHEILRTTFHETGWEPVQVVAPPAPLPLVDLAGLATETRAGEGRRL
ncbi:MAG TPA: amino acid adenylation domain-containing protein, partial [Thermoanaerobaculia bacterium]|nr:amino acid adenylation domain-containing protein [Thermoanaerobaculia bacterium]